MRLKGGGLCGRIVMLPRRNDHVHLEVTIWRSSEEEKTLSKSAAPSKTKRIAVAKAKKEDFFGRLEGIIEIVGDPDDLINPVFPLEDYDMLK